MFNNHQQKTRCNKVLALDDRDLHAFAVLSYRSHGWTDRQASYKVKSILAVLYFQPHNIQFNHDQQTSRLSYVIKTIRCDASLLALTFTENIKIDRQDCLLLYLASKLLSHQQWAFIRLLRLHNLHKSISSLFGSFILESSFKFQGFQELQHN